ncbi:tropomyosin-like [Drosophila novamexicana]|uniref:tropomyosin-like n=1 Tax=Drosophila novamexicana TaxID=47314 RepID=UPI0011E5B3B6|nr:tropomyosin-like [Drosophila novamexicana]
MCSLRKQNGSRHNSGQSNCIIELLQNKEDKTNNSKLGRMLGRQGLILDALKHKIHVAKNDLERYREEYTHCQTMLQRELERRSQLEESYMDLQRRNVELEDELQLALTHVAHHQATVREARGALNESDRLRKALEHRDQLQSEKIELLVWELAKLKRQAKEADRTAQYSGQRADQLCERLTHSEQQLEASRTSHAVLQAELDAAAQNLHCVERAFERSAQQVQSFDRQVAKLKQRLHESEKRAHQAELNAHQLQQSSANLEKRLEERVEQRWLKKLHKLDLQLVAKE